MDLLKRCTPPEPADRILENWQKLAKGKKPYQHSSPSCLSVPSWERKENFHLLHSFQISISRRKYLYEQFFVYRDSGKDSSYEYPCFLLIPFFPKKVIVVCCLLCVICWKKENERPDIFLSFLYLESLAFWTVRILPWSPLEGRCKYGFKRDSQPDRLGIQDMKWEATVPDLKGVYLRGSQSIKDLSSQPSLSQCQKNPILAACVQDLELEVSHLLMGYKRHPFTRSFLWPVTREGLCFLTLLMLTLTVNFPDL